MADGGGQVQAEVPLAANGLPVKFWRVGYPLGHEIPSKNDAATEALYDTAHACNLGKFPWASHLKYRGSVRVESIRIDDNRNNLCEMFLDRDDAEVLIQLDRDEIVPPDGVLQLVHGCTPQTPVVSGVYFQRSLENPYPHVYRHSHVAPNKWGEESRHSTRLVEEVYRRLVALGVSDHVAEMEQGAFRLAQPDGTPLPEAMRFIKDGAFGGTGLTAIHASLLRAMKAAGPPFYPWFRERGEKGDMAFFNLVHELGYETAVDCTVFAGHIAEEVVGLKHFWSVFGPAVALADAIRRPTRIESVAVVIPTLDPAQAAYVLSALTTTSGLPAESITGIVVADYGRRGGTRTLNDGVTAALNAGTDAVLLLDDDLHFHQDGWLRRLCDALAPAGVGAVGPSLQCRGIQNGTPEQFTAAAGGNPDAMPYLCGAVMLYKRAALESVGQLDERLRHYASDTDHGFALRKAGWTLRWVPEVRVEHAIAGTGFFRDDWNRDHDLLAEKWGLPRQAVATVVRPESDGGQVGEVGRVGDGDEASVAGGASDAPIGVPPEPAAGAAPAVSRRRRGKAGEGGGSRGNGVGSAERDLTATGGVVDVAALGGVEVAA